MPMDVDSENHSSHLYEEQQRLDQHVVSFTPFDCSGKRHVLPLKLLMQLKGLIRKKADVISKEILSAGVGPKPATSQHIDDIDDDSWSDFKAFDLFECSDTSKKKPKHSKRKRWNSQERARANANGDDNDGHKAKKARPNYFIAVQVTNPEILSIGKKVQSGIQEKSEVDLEPAFIAVEKFHITLMVMHLPNTDEIKKAAESLEKCVPAIQERTCGQPVKLDFESLSTFGGGRVLFTPLKASEGLDHLHFMADEVSKQMNSAGIFSTDGPSKKFNPHLTIMKFKGDKKLLKQGVKKVERAQYQDFADETFGVQSVCSMQLCSMQRKREDGYYFVEHEVFFCK